MFVVLLFSMKIKHWKNICGTSKSKAWQTDGQKEDGQSDPYKALCSLTPQKRVVNILLSQIVKT